MPSAIQGKNAGFGRNILRPYFISHQALNTIKHRVGESYRGSRFLHHSKNWGRYGTYTLS